jgi:uncharacterized protein (DUF2147 family)
MKKLSFLAARIFLGAVIVCAQEIPDPAAGFWLSVDSKTGAVQSGWEIYQSGGVLYGKMLSGEGISADDTALRCKDSYPGFPVEGKTNQLPVLGSPWIFGLKKENSGVWSGGFVINPLNGKIYKCRITWRPADGKRFSQETLEMRSETVLGIGRSQYCRRATVEQAGALR